MLIHNSVCRLLNEKTLIGMSFLIQMKVYPAFVDYALHPTTQK